MLRNYFKTIIRSLQRNRAFTLINVFGLSLGLAAFITISEYVRFEKSFDNYHPDHERIVRVGMDVNFGDGDLNLAYMGAPGTRLISADFPQVEESIRLYMGYRRDYFVKLGDKEFEEKAATKLMADENFFDFFGIGLIHGNPADVLEGPNKVVLTESTVARYFGSDWSAQNVLGQSIQLSDTLNLQISGISVDVPENTHFDFNLLISMKTAPEEADNLWFRNSFYHFFRLQEGVSPGEFKAQLDRKSKDYLDGDIKTFLGLDYSTFFANEGRYFNFTVLPINEIHLESQRELEMEANGNKAYVKIFAGIAILVLLMAAINFMNLSAVSGLKRHKEIGVRKVLGSLKRQVIFQFLMESVLVVLCSLVFAITIVQVLAPMINGFYGADLVRSLTELIPSIGLLILGAIGLGMLSGMYPAWTLAVINPISSIKGLKASNGRAGFFRNGLIVFQFAISLLLIIGVWGIRQQLQHMQSQDLGYNKEQVMVIENVSLLGNEARTLRDQLAASPLVHSATLAGFVPIGSMEYGTTGLKLADGSSEFTLRLNFATIDEHYLETYQLELLSGRDFSAEYGNEQSNMIVNEAFLRAWGWTAEEALGKRLTSVGIDEVVTIVGVVKDFQVFSMKSKDDPFVLSYEYDNQNISIRFESDDWEQARALTADIWSQFSDKPLSYSLADTLFETIFEQEKRAGQLFTAFSLLALFIGCLGLLGVASYVIVQRSKEVGIRKVLGASMPQLFTVLSRDFVWLILIAGVISIPASYYLLSEWLTQYAYQVGLNWWLFTLPFLFVGFLAFSIIGMQIWKVAIINPIKSLRYE